MAEKPAQNQADRSNEAKIKEQPESTGVTYDHALHSGDTTYSRTFNLDLADYNGGSPDRPCGHVVSIYASTVLAPDDASLWTAVLNSIT